MKTFIIAALTADGFIARDEQHTSTDWTSQEDKQMFRQTTKGAGIMVMGSKTFDTIGRGMPGRKIIVYTSHPDKYSGIEGVESTALEPAELLRRLEGHGFKEVAICGGASIYHLFMAAGVVDELRLTIEPLAFGSGISLFDNQFNDNAFHRLELAAVNHLNDQTLQLIYRTHL